jgi:hypothetical protein
VTRRNTKRLAAPGYVRELMAQAHDPTVGVSLGLYRGPLPDARADLERLSRLCWGCGRAGHRRGDCPQVRCHTCGGTGHLSRRCPIGRGTGGGWS